MEHYTARQRAKRTEVMLRTAHRSCWAGRILGAVKLDDNWLIPSGVLYPEETWPEPSRAGEAGPINPYLEFTGTTGEYLSCSVASGCFLESRGLHGLPPQGRWAGLGQPDHCMSRRHALFCSLALQAVRLLQAERPPSIQGFSGIVRHEEYPIEHLRRTGHLQVLQAEGVV